MKLPLPFHELESNRMARFDSHFDLAGHIHEGPNGEIRIENILEDSNGNEVKLKAGDQVDVTVKPNLKIRPLLAKRTSPFAS